MSRQGFGEVEVPLRDRSLWDDVKELPLIEAVCLSIGANPKIITSYEDLIVEHFLERLEVAKKELRRRKIPAISVREDKIELSVVDLKGFLLWALDFKWAIPRWVIRGRC